MNTLSNILLNNSTIYIHSVIHISDMQDECKSLLRRLNEKHVLQPNKGEAKTSVRYGLRRRNVPRKRHLDNNH